jgi:hypothetical protein
MTAIDRTVYPRPGTRLTREELSARYDLTEADLAFIRASARGDMGRLVLATLLKTRRDLGCFPAPDAVTTSTGGHGWRAVLCRQASEGRSRTGSGHSRGVSAGSPSVASEVTVYVIDESGYVKVRLVQAPTLAPVQIAGIDSPPGARRPPLEGWANEPARL